MNQYDSTAVRMMQSGRVIRMDDFIINTALGFESLTLNFRLWTFLRSTTDFDKWKNPYFVNVTIELTCNDEYLE